ncbi:MAG: transglutaminase domain-containing protein [Candidatus Limivivens sp.]|nr:transglutaminase domain-containing protein [Candidatus Limivivens sp.]
MRRVRRFLMGFFLLMACALPVQATESSTSQNNVSASEVKHEFYQFEYARDYLKQQLIKREEKISFTLLSPSPDGEELLKQLIKEATAVTSTTKGREGDYIDLHVERYEKDPSCCSIPVYGKNHTEILYYEHQFTYLINYYTTWDQEKEMSIRVSQVLSDLNLSDKSTYEKIQTIYDYVCKNVTYDNSSDPGKFSAYNALVKRKAVCQGYSSLIYRLMRDAGIECRVIKGKASGVEHSWNIVRIGSRFYNLDATWDAGKDPEDYKCFLKIQADFPNHSRASEYKTAAFLEEYPMAEEAYCFGNHTWASEYTVDIEPTCSSYGLKSIHCVKCDEVKEGSLRQVKKTAHTYGAWTVTKKATIFEEGTRVRTCSACGAERTGTLKKLTSKVSLNAESVRMKVGQTSGALKIAKQSTGDSVLKWTSSKSSVVSVGKASGKLTAKKTGSAVITVTMKSGTKAACKVTVGRSTVKAKTIAFSKKKQTLTTGDSLKLEIVYNPITAVDKISYVISKNGVLTIKNGVITAQKSGVAYVKATTKSGLTAKCRITVKDPG